VTELMISLGVNVVLGLVVVLLVIAYRRRFRHELRLANRAAALEAFRAQFPDARGTATVMSDGQAALLTLDEGGEIALVQRHGDRWIARMLSPGAISAADGHQEGVIRLKFADYGWPGTQLLIADNDERTAWLARLQALKAPSSASARTDLSHA